MVVNSHPLYQLSYRGIGLGGILPKACGGMQVFFRSEMPDGHLGVRVRGSAPLAVGVALGLQGDMGTGRRVESRPVSRVLS